MSRALASASRRRFIGAVAAAVPALAGAASGRPSGANVIDVKTLGAFGDGKLPDARQIREAFRRAAETRGSTVFFPPGEYFLGAADDALLLELAGARDVRLVGDRATLTCRSVKGQSNMLQLTACRDVSIEGFTFRDRGLNREINWLGAAAIRLANGEGSGCENISIARCTFDSVLAALVCRGTENGLRVRTRNVKLTDLTVRGSYYGFSFQDNGDDVVGRGLRCDDVKRSYFPFGVTNHSIELETVNNATGFTDVLIKCYNRDTSRVAVKVKCRGKRGGDAIVALDHQHRQGRGTMRQIDVQLDVDDIDCRLDSVVLIRSFDPNAKYEKQTQNRWEDIALDGEVRVCAQTKLIDIATVGSTPGQLRIGPKLAKNPALPRKFPGFNVSGV